MKKLVYVALLFSAVVGLSACNTMSGVGQDMQDAGKAIEKKAND